MLNFLPNAERSEILNINGQIEEVRIRVGRQCLVVYSQEGKRKRSLVGRVFDSSDVERILMELCDYSSFSKEESIRQAFATSSEGERVGLCGRVVYEGEKIVTVKDVTSCCVRFPNEAIGCSEPFARRHLSKPKSCLIISPPFEGKTTFLRDLGRYCSDELSADVLFLDERDEFFANGKFHLGKNSDVMRYARKDFGFENGVRAMNPDVVVADELIDEKDAISVAAAALSGVKTLASAHSDNLENLLKKSIFKGIFEKGVFDYYVELSYGSINKIRNSLGREL